MSHRKKHFKWMVSATDIQKRNEIQSLIGDKKYIRVKNEIPKLMATAQKITISQKRYDSAKRNQFKEPKKSKRSPVSRPEPDPVQQRNDNEQLGRNDTNVSSPTID